uniref:Methyltransferase type 11 domain-containing protein n=1 Tax=Rhodosorus marinus TaxID=101924 RepID=A0A7S0BTJ8_9RHOD|mmetsp:Transcript_8852/g.12933  ORF Transcript_8852/g.12933 Transcript_8852/m.12933 type:complete len:312 (+) Transcript_8852:206-1141(+)
MLCFGLLASGVRLVRHKSVTSWSNRVGKWRPRTLTVSCMSEVELESGSNQSVYACSNCGADLPLSKSRCDACGMEFKNESANYVNRVAPPSNSRGLQRFGFGPIRQEMFRSSLVSFLYERGWRDAFQRYGFPGPEAEFQMLLDFCEENGQLNSIAADVSCGSGFMARLMQKSGKFSRVIVSDFSESMLDETVARFQKESKLDPADRDIVRADIAKLPFKSSSVNVIHNGAAIHTYPRAQDGLREMHRILADGGVLFGTTMDKRLVGFSLPSSNPGFRFFSNRELFYLLKGAGFRDPVVENLNKCLVFKAIK